jgi:hypothetical protein
VYWFLLDIVQKMVCKRVRLASAQHWKMTVLSVAVDAETKGPDDERMSTFGCSDWPKPIVADGDRQVRELGQIRDSVTLVPPNISPHDTCSILLNLPTPAPLAKCTVDRLSSCSPSLPLLSIPSPVPHFSQTVTAVFSHHQHG